MRTAVIGFFLTFATLHPVRGEGPGFTFANGQARITTEGLVDFRAVQTDDEVGFFDSGQGKTRFGGSRNDGSRLTGGIGEASVLVHGRYGSSWASYLHLKYDKDQVVPIDAVEGFLRYRPVSTSAWRFGARVGAFFPPVSLENIDVAWQSPYTISWSAINSWIGEEVRAAGGEVTAEYRRDGGRVEIGGSVFAGNDPAGIILAKRGWALHDRATTLFDRLVKPLSSPDQVQHSTVDIVAELDNRPGYYLFGRAVDEDAGSRLIVTFYDNNADPSAIRGSQEAWQTRFLAVGAGYELPLPEPWESTLALELVSQAMTGTTEHDSRAGPIDVRYHAAFLMLSAAFGDTLPQTLSFRWDGFQTEDRLPLQGGPHVYDETGYALTLSYSMVPKENHRLSAELLAIKSDRPARDGTGEERTQRNTNLILSYRYTF